MFRNSIDVYLKSTFSKFLKKLNAPTKILNVPMDQAGLKSGGAGSCPLLHIVLCPKDELLHIYYNYNKPTVIDLLSY